MNLKFSRFIVVANLVWTQCVPGTVYSEELSAMKYPLVFDTPAEVWDEALPLANGLMGALVWGDGHPLIISLDRTDLWDLRPVPEFHSQEYSFELMKEWVQKGRIEDLRRVYEDPYHYAGPTKIPAGRIELFLPKEREFHRTRLSIDKGIAETTFSDGVTAEVWIQATESVGMIEIQGTDTVDANLLPPAFGKKEGEDSRQGISAGSLSRLEYDTPKEASGESWTGYLQEGWGGFRFAVALAWTKRGDHWRGCWAIVTSEESANPLEEAVQRTTRGLAQNPDELRQDQERWWRNYWEKVSISIPNPVLERQWYLETYKFGAAARRGNPPISLQGPWTADNGKLPPWKGDYHHDLNTELTYWPCYSGNRLGEGLGFLDWLWETRDNCRDWTQRFFDSPGLNVPGTSDLRNRQIGGWHQYTHSLTTGCWLAHHFYLHWRYSMDRDFLTERAYPYLTEVAEFIEAMSEIGPDGRRTLPLSSSPEINDNRLDAWFPTMTNYDLALVRWMFGAAAELAHELGKSEEAQHWREMLEEMPEFALSPEDHRLLVAKGTPLHSSHRHHSHLMAIYPLGLIRWENGEQDRETIRGALTEMERLGSSAWTGYSFAWQACIAARAKDGALAERALEIFSTAFCLRNSFHCNGDQSGKGYSHFTYRPFTLEGNFAAAAGIQEMLLQSYGGVLRIFPAVPKSWETASFHSLRGEGAFIVSADLDRGLVSRVEIHSETGGLCRLENCFGKGDFQVEGIEPDQIQKEGNLLMFPMKAGESAVFRRVDRLFGQ